MGENYSRYGVELTKQGVKLDIIIMYEGEILLSARQVAAFVVENYPAGFIKNLIRVFFILIPIVIVFSYIDSLIRKIEDLEMDRKFMMKEHDVVIKEKERDIAYLDRILRGGLKLKADKEKLHGQGISSILMADTLPRNRV